MKGFFQAFSFALDANVSPHDGSYGVANVGEVKGWVRWSSSGIGDWQYAKFGRGSLERGLGCVSSCDRPVDESFEEAVGGESIRAVQSGAGDFAGSPESWK